MSQRLGHLYLDTDQCPLSPKAISAFNQEFNQESLSPSRNEVNEDQLFQRMKLENQRLKSQLDQAKAVSDVWKVAAEQAQTELKDKNSQIQALQAKNKQYQERIGQLVAGMDKLQKMVAKYCDQKKQITTPPQSNSNQFKPFKIKENYPTSLASSPSKMYPGGYPGVNSSSFSRVGSGCTSGYTSGYTSGCTSGYTSSIPGLSIPGISSYKPKVNAKYNSSYSYRPKEQNINLISFKKKDYGLTNELQTYKRQKMLESQTVEGVMRIQKCFSNFNR